MYKVLVEPVWWLTCTNYTSTQDAYETTEYIWVGIANTKHKDTVEAAVLESTSDSSRSSSDCDDTGLCLSQLVKAHSNVFLELNKLLYWSEPKFWNLTILTPMTSGSQNGKNISDQATGSKVMNFWKFWLFEKNLLLFCLRGLVMFSTIFCPLSLYFFLGKSPNDQLLIILWQISWLPAPKPSQMPQSLPSEVSDVRLVLQIVK